jgi:hypothetical protein
VSESLLVQAEAAAQREGSEIEFLQGELARRQAELSRLQLIIAFLRAFPTCSPADLEGAAQILRRLSEQSSEQSPIPAAVPHTNGAPANGALATGNDLTGKTISEAAAVILGEHPDRPMHYARVARIALQRGYRATRSDSSEETVVRSFRQIMQRDANKSGSNILGLGQGMYTYSLEDEEEVGD